MTSLVVYYSLTGNTKKVAESIAAELDAELEAVELADPGAVKDGKPCGKLVMGPFFGILPDVKPTEKDLHSYGHVILGAPVWATQLASPMKAFLKARRDRLPPNVSFFVCYGGKFAANALKHMEKYSKRQPKATLILKDEEIKSGILKEKVKSFALKGYEDYLF